MRLTIAGELKRFDPDPLVRLWPALFDQWTSLQFDHSGHVLHPGTGEPDSRFRLVERRHRQVGARYEVTVDTPILELPPEQLDEFTDEYLALIEAEASQEELSAHFERRRDASVQVGMDRQVFVVTVLADEPRRLAVTISEERARWSVDVELHHRRLPRVDVEGTVDLTAMLRDTMPGFLARFLGGRGSARAKVDLAAIEGPGGTFLDASGSANRFRGSARIDLALSKETWRIDGFARLKARGLGRLVVWILKWRGRRQAQGEIDRWFAVAPYVDVEHEIRELPAAIERAGGEAAFVHRMLWDPEFEHHVTRWNDQP